MPVITREGADALIPQEVSREILKELPKDSAVMRLGKRLRNMTSKEEKLPVLSGLITGGWVTGDTGLKTTSRAEWEGKVITAEEMAVIVPIPEAVKDDMTFDVWDEVKPQVIEEFGRIFDGTVLRGEDAPASFPDSILTGAAAASQTVDLSTVELTGDIYDAILGVGGVLSKVEEDGYGVTGHVGDLSLKAKLRSLRTDAGVPIFNQNMQGATNYALDGQPIFFPENGSMDPLEALLFSGDWRRLVYSVRQDVTFKIIDQGVISDNQGKILYNFAQQDMVGLRCVFRIGWQLPNPINRVNSNSATRYPFAVLVP